MDLLEIVASLMCCDGLKGCWYLVFGTAFVSSRVLVWAEGVVLSSGCLGCFSIYGCWDFS